MKLKLIYPSWPKLRGQTKFHLPPHGPVVMAATIPEDVEVEFIDDNVQSLDFEPDADLVALSVMLTCQLPRAFEIADTFRSMGMPVLFGGISTTLHRDEVAEHADSIFLGETEGRFAAVIDDFKKGRLKKVYDYTNNHPDISLVDTARRDILDRELYNYRGVQMVDLVHASRGCRFNCFPCCSRYLGGKRHRTRPISKVVQEMESIPNNRLFLVDNSLAQNKKWLRELFSAIRPLKKKWISHPVFYDPEIIDMAAKAGCWYVYQAIIDTSEKTRERIKMLKDHGIGIEGTILLGTDDHDESFIKRLVDFLLENELDLAEFTILTPFMHTPIRKQFEEEGRILSNDWIKYTTDQVVFQPAKMTPEKLHELYDYAWEAFYGKGGQQLKMARLFRKVIEKEKKDGTYRRYELGGRKTGPIEMSSATQSAGT